MLLNMKIINIYVFDNVAVSIIWPDFPLVHKMVWGHILKNKPIRRQYSDTPEKHVNILKFFTKLNI